MSKKTLFLAKFIAVCDLIIILICSIIIGTFTIVKASSLPEDTISNETIVEDKSEEAKETEEESKPSITPEAIIEENTQVIVETFESSAEIIPTVISNISSDYDEMTFEQHIRKMIHKNAIAYRRLMSSPKIKNKLVAAKLASATAATVSDTIPKEIIETESEKEEKYINQILDKTSNVPNGEKGCKSQFKSWMRATSISAKKSGQWKILHSENCYEDPDTHFMMYRCEDGEERICCAVGTYYTELIGTKLNIIFEDGHMIKCIMADQKANQHTDKSNRYHLCDGSVLEFVVSSNFKGDSTYPEWTKGKIHYIDVLDAVNDGKGFVWD